MTKFFFFFYNINVKDVYVLCYTNSSIVAVQAESITYRLSEKLLL
ncbi:hypothetical protein AMTRI_Chr01g103390 [Amborella trichopoda]